MTAQKSPKVTHIVGRAEPQKRKPFQMPACASLWSQKNMLGPGPLQGPALTISDR